MKVQKFEVDLVLADEHPTPLEMRLNLLAGKGYRVLNIIPGYGDPGTNEGVYCASKIVMYREPRSSEIIDSAEWKERHSTERHVQEIGD